MLSDLFSFLDKLSSQGPLLAITAALLWGFASIIFSPCHLSSIPLIIAYISRGTVPPPARAFLLSAVFSLGIFISIAVIGFVTALLGRLIGDIGPFGNYIVAAIFILFGLVMLDVIHLPWSQVSAQTVMPPGVWGAFILGLIFGLAVGPCTFAYMAPILAVVFNQGQTNLPLSGALIGAFSIGHCSLIILAGTVGAQIQRWLDWDNRHKLSIYFKKGCGILMILAGLYLLYKAKSK